MNATIIANISIIALFSLCRFLPYAHHPTIFAIHFTDQHHISSQSADNRQIRNCFGAPAENARFCRRTMALKRHGRIFLWHGGESRANLERIQARERAWLDFERNLLVSVKTV